MTNILNQSEYQLFKSWAPQNKISIGTYNEKIWKFYEYGPKECKAPIVFISHYTAEIYYKQFLTLCPRGHRVISVQYTPYDTTLGWCKGFERFLDRLELDKVHIFGTNFSGYLAQCFYQTKPSRVLSMILNNTFSDTQYFHDNSPFSSLFTLLPEFLLKRIVLNGFPSGELDNETMKAVDFMVEQVDTLNQSELSSLLSLNYNGGNLNPTGGLNDNITIIDSIDCNSVPEKLREEVYKYYPNAKFALLKSGGEFCYISRSEEVNIHIEVHLRRFDGNNNNNNNGNNSNRNSIKLDDDNNNVNNNNNNINNNRVDESVPDHENNQNNSVLKKENSSNQIKVSSTTISHISEATRKLNTSVFDNDDDNSAFL